MKQSLMALFMQKTPIYHLQAVLVLKEISILVEITLHLMVVLIQKGKDIIAPNADVKVVAGAHIKGAIVADRIIVDGGASITFSESNASNGNGGNGNGNNNQPNIPPAPSPPKVDIIEDIILET